MDETKNQNTEEAPKKRFSIININGVKYKTSHTKKYKERKKYKPKNPKEIKSFIPGTVLKINVKKGSKVRKGKILLIFDSMKMKNRILAPESGVVKKINCEPGDRVPKDYILLEME